MSPWSNLLSYRGTTSVPRYLPKVHQAEIFYYFNKLPFKLFFLPSGQQTSRSMVGLKHLLFPFSQPKDTMIMTLLSVNPLNFCDDT